MMTFRALGALGFVGHLLVLIVASHAIQTHSRCLLGGVFSRIDTAEWSAVTCQRVPTGPEDARLKDAFSGKAIVRAMNALMGLENVLPLPKRALAVRILEKEKRVVGFSDEALELGVEIAADPAELQKYLVMAWLRSLAPEPERLDTLSWEIQAEVLTGWLTPNSVYGQLETLSWLDGLMTFREYCQWTGRSLQHEEFCQSPTNLIQQTLDQPTIWGFRSVMRQKILARFKALSPTRQRQLVFTWNHQFKVPASSRLPEDYRSLASFRTWLATSVQDWFGESSRPPDAGYQLSLAPEVDLMVEGELEFDSAPVIRNRPWARVQEEKVFSPNLNKWTGFYSHEISARQRLFVGCELPAVKAVMEWRTEGAGFVRWCRREPLKAELDRLLERPLQSELSRLAPSHSFYLNLPLFRKTVNRDRPALDEAVKELTL